MEILIMLLGLVIRLLGFACSILPVVGMWLVFEKAGEQGWKAIVPLYNIYTLLMICDKRKYWTMYLYGVAIYILSVFLLVFIGMWALIMFFISFGDITLGLQSILTINALTICLFIGFVTGYILMFIPTIHAYIGVCHKMQQNTKMVLGLIFLGPIFWMLLGAGKQYQWKQTPITECQASVWNDTYQKSPQV